MVQSCPHCKGTGFVSSDDFGNEEPYPCKYCKGVGFILKPEPKPEDPKQPPPKSD